MREKSLVLAIVVAACVLFVLQAGGVTVNQRAKCERDPFEILKYYQWNKSNRSWQLLDNDCGFRSYNSGDVFQLLGGKTILFVGDSTLRNVAESLLASLCNPLYWQSCNQRLHWPFQQTDIYHAMTCHNESSENVCPQFRGEVKFSMMKLDGLTTDDYYMSKRERYLFWKKGLVPPLIIMTFRDVRFMVLEAACIKPHDGLPKAADWFAKNWRTLPHSIDLIISSGGYHCTYHEYKKKPPWYYKVGHSMRELRQIAPVVWIEASNCTKDRTGHFIYTKRKGTNVTVRPTLNVHKLVSCDFAGAYSTAINRFMHKNGIVVSPTRFMTTNITMVKNVMTTLSKEEEESPCAFSDPLHMSLKCYGFGLQVHLNSIRIALQTWRKPENSLLSSELPSTMESDFEEKDSAWGATEAIELNATMAPRFDDGTEPNTLLSFIPVVIVIPFWYWVRRRSRR